MAQDPAHAHLVLDSVDVEQPSEQTVDQMGWSAVALVRRAAEEG